MGIILNDPAGSKCNRQGPYKKEAEGPLMLFPIPLAKQVYTLAYLHKIWWVFFFFHKQDHLCMHHSAICFCFFLNYI